MLLHERVEQIKGKVLDVIESKVNENASIAELQGIADVLKSIDDDKNLYLKMISAISGKGFNGKSNSDIPANTEKAE